MSELSTRVEDTRETGISWINSSGVSVDEVAPAVDKVARELANWVTQSRDSRRLNLFDRAAYIAPNNPYRLMEVGRKAVENDDVVGGVCDVTEGLMLQGIKWEDEDADTADVFNQMNRDLNLDEFARQWHREDFKYSQVVVGIWWGRKTYTVRGRTQVEDKEAPPVADPTSLTGQKPKMKQGPRRKKKYEIACPVALTFLDPQKVVPLSPGPFGQDRLAWHATKDEFANYLAAQDGAYMDPMMQQFIAGPVHIGKDEEALIASWGLDPKRLLLLNPAFVFRSSRTKISYERFPDNRLKSVFPLLDLKQQLMEADRVSLVGAANYILLVKKGEKDDPASQEEIDNLQENFKVVAKLPVIVGDHRLNIEIITPDQEYVLDSGKYDVLDRRIMSRTLGALTIASNGQRNESTLTVARGVARLLETRRHMMKRALETEIARAVVDHPFNKGKFDTEPNLTFTPRNVQLDADAQVVQAIMALRTQKELSRETTLEFFGFDQTTEAQRREFEESSGLDDIFQTQVPFTAGPGGPGEGPNGGPVSPQQAGTQGGRPAGGGKSPQSPQSQTKPKTGSGNKKTGA